MLTIIWDKICHNENIFEITCELFQMKSKLKKMMMHNCENNSTLKRLEIVSKDGIC